MKIYRKPKLIRNSKTYPVDIDYNDMGQRLRAERKRLHYTQEQVAEAIGITPAFVGHIERGERSLSLETLIHLCDFYSVTIDYILAETLPPTDDNVAAQIKGLLKGKSQEEQAAILDVMRAVVRNI